MFDLRELARPVLGAPMAGGPSTPALAAAVSDAGGLGFLAAGYKPAEAVATEIATLRGLTSAPFGLNLFLVAPWEPDEQRLSAYCRSLAPDAERLGVELGTPRWDDDRWQAKLDAVFDLRPDLVSFTFGCPASDLLRRLSDAGICTAVTVTSVAEARAAAERGAATLAVQGPLAGGHRGTWDQQAEPDRTPLAELLAVVAATVDVPVAAGGGLATAEDVAGVIRRGAVAAQVGTAYLRADEAGTNPVHRAALADPAFPRTDVTRAYTGRWARGLLTQFMTEHPDAPAAYPHLHHVTAPMRAAAVAQHDPQRLHLWAGAGHAATRTAPAAEITRALAP